MSTIKKALAANYNKLSQALLPNTKIFFIGFNKTATVSMHVLMERHRIKSVHWLETRRPDAANVAVEIEKRLSDPEALKTYMSRWTAFSDLHHATTESWIEGNRHFRLFDRLFPRSFFILNDRDTDDWIASRLKHNGGMLLRCASARFAASENEVVDMWRSSKERHFAEVFDHFRGHERFLHYRIDQDPPSKLTRFLAPVFLIGTKRWPHVNRTQKGVKRGS